MAMMLASLGAAEARAEGVGTFLLSIFRAVRGSPTRNKARRRAGGDQREQPECSWHVAQALARSQS